MDIFDRIMELSRYGYFCSQILAILLLETIGEENPGFVKAMGGLNGGIGFSHLYFCKSFRSGKRNDYLAFST